MSEADLPERPDAAQQPRIGVDEWVASVEERRERAAGLAGLVGRSWDALPPAGRLGIFVVPAAFFPLLTNSGDLFRYGVFTLIYALLALGLNTVVGFAGLLDLGYIAFFGFGAYGYGILASPQFDNHFQADVALISFAAIATILHLVSESRTGRAWKALREDPLAAEVMSIPVNRLKLLAFVFGAAVAGLTGTIYAALITGAFPGDYDIGLLITIYAVVILGGAGSLAGVVLGAIVVNIVPELLRSATNAHWLFYGAILLGLLLKLRPWARLASVAVGVVAVGFVVRMIFEVAGATRLILLGALLVVLMNARPQGLLGTARVEIA